MPTKDNKHLKDLRGGMLGQARRAIGGRAQQLEEAERQAVFGNQKPRKQP